MTGAAEKQISADDLVELEFLETVVRRIPKDVAVWKALADLYTRVGRYEDGLRLDRKLSRACPDEPLVWYNLGCSLALVHRAVEALEALGRAVELGYRDYEWMNEDSDLQSLWNDQRFQSLLKQLAP